MAGFGLLVASALPVPAQTGSSKPCLAQSEQIYTPGEDHVKPPKLRIERGPLEKPLKSTSRVVLEVVINSAGKICEVRALKTPDRETAQQLEEHVADNFLFSPATRKGEPVASWFRVVFNVGGNVTTQE